MEKMSLANYLDVSDNENSEKPLAKAKRRRSRSSSSSSGDSSRKKSIKSHRRKESRRHKKHRKHSSRRRRSYSSSSSSEARRSRSRHQEKRHKKKSESSPDSSSSSSVKEEKIKLPKWSALDEDQIKEEKKIVTLGKKPEPVKKIEELMPNENIPLEQKELPSFEPSGLLAKQTNTKK